MTSQERQRVGEVLAVMSAYYGRELKRETLSLMLDDLEDLPAVAVLGALTAYRRDPKNRAFPLPAQIRAIVQPGVDPESAAREIAARITAAIPKFGWCNGQEARAYIGEVGWQVVCDQGGWSHLCQHHGIDIDPSAFQAQIRDLAKSRLTHKPEAMANVIGLPSNQRRGELTAAKDVLALLEDPEGA